MRKIIFFVILLFSAFSYGQLKQTKLTDEEVNILGTKTNQGFGVFNYDEIKKYKLENILAYVVEFQYEGKTIATALVDVSYTIGAGYTSFSLPFKRVNICFKTADLPNEIQFALLKESSSIGDNSWKIENDEAQQEYLCPSAGIGGVALFYTEDYKRYKLNSLAGDKIKMILYKLER